MVLHIKELFLEIINHYYYHWNNDNVNYNFYQFIPIIIQFNTISKIHYEWIKDCIYFKSSNL